MPKAQLFFNLIDSSYFLQHGGCPLWSAWLLVAAAARWVGGEEGLGIGREGHDATLGEGEESVALDGLDDGHRVPHLLPRITVVCHIHLLDGVTVGPVDVGNDLIGEVLHLLPHLHGREDHVNILRPEVEERVREFHALLEVEVGLVCHIEDASHEV